MLIKDFGNKQAGYDGLMDFTLFNCTIEVIFGNKEVTLEYAEKCAEYLNNMSNNTIEKLCEYSILYCEEHREYFHLDNIEIPVNVKSREILKYIRPALLIVEEPKNENIGFHLELNCDWEPEHGMQWVINNNEILYVGGFSGENPWRDREYFKKASWNYVKFDN